MSDLDIIKAYKKGFSINYIANSYYKFINRNLKPVMHDGVLLVPVKLYTKSDCRLHVIEVIYKYLCT